FGLKCRDESGSRPVEMKQDWGSRRVGRPAKSRGGTLYFKTRESRFQFPMIRAKIRRRHRRRRFSSRAICSVRGCSAWERRPDGAPFARKTMSEVETTREGPGWDLAAESITVKIRWFGVVVGYVLVNLLDRPVETHRPVVNAILTLGA